MTELVSSKITIKNFVVIKSANIDIKDINIIIGAQSSGKSLIAKLIYFFNTLNEIFVQHVYQSNEAYSLEDEAFKRFSLLFPSYLWRNKSFKIKYSIGNIWISLVYTKKTESDEPEYKFIFSKTILKVTNEIKSNLIERSDSREIKVGEKIYRMRKRVPLFEIENDFKERLPYYFGRNLFMPSGRSFLHALKKNVFSLEKLQIDPFISEFGVEYTDIKKYFTSEDNISLEDMDKKAFDSILMGDYQYDEDEDEDWIVSATGHKTKLAHASSGQQEALPMLAMMTIFPVLMDLYDEQGMMFIEEPEAHIFPTAQGEVVSFISSLYSKYKARFFMTSHSPYIISALNNMIQANEIIRKGLLTEKQFHKLNKGGASIPFENVSAYTIENGVAKSIMDEEYKMIGAYKLDDISNHFQSVMDYLLELES